MPSDSTGNRCFVYVLVNPQGETYVGHTENPDRRLAQHNNPLYRGSLHTKRHGGPWTLLHTETFSSCSEALRRERELKSGKGRGWIRQTLQGKP